MRGIGGNINATIQVKTTTKNTIGESVQEWSAVQTLRGWLDLAAGKSGYSSFHAKIQESTHIFIGDYVPLDKRITAENSRMVIKGKVYDIMLLDNPMELESGSQWEIYLKYTGGR
jgi:head-tail adaptor